MMIRRLSSESAYIAGVIGAGNSTKINNLVEMLSFVSVAEKDGTLNLTEKNSLKELILAGNIDAAKTLISILQSKGEEWVCAACTFKNAAARVKCATCSGERHGVGDSAVLGLRLEEEDLKPRVRSIISLNYI
jgi:hypothetical protein